MIKADVDVVLRTGVGEWCDVGNCKRWREIHGGGGTPAHPFPFELVCATMRRSIESRTMETIEEP